MAAGPPILVTGSHRSGTTWVGRMLAAAPGVVYLSEPFSITDPPEPAICEARFHHWFTYVGDANEAEYLDPFRRMVGLEYRPLTALGGARSLWQLRRAGADYRRFRHGRHNGSRPLLKDPLAFFSSEWLASRFGASVVVTIRHPAAFANSIMRLKWTHPFSHFLDQPLLMESFLHPFEEEIRAFAREEREILDQAVLLWRIVYGTVLEYQRRHPEWIFVRHEDLSLDPVASFRDLFGRLGLEFTDDAKRTIVASSDARNPREAGTAPGDDYSVMRDSRASISNWKRRLTSEQIDRIRRGVADVSPAFYSESEW